MAIRKIFIAMLAGTLFGCSNKPKEEANAKPAAPVYEALVMPTSTGDSSWGYVITYNNKEVIKQFFIPALEGNQHFTNRQEAEKVAHLVAGKLNHSLRPAVSKKELDSLGIIQSIHVTSKK